MLLWPPRDEVEDAAELVLSSIMAQALPATIHIAASMDDMAHKVRVDWCRVTLLFIHLLDNLFSCWIFSHFLYFLHSFLSSKSLYFHLIICFYYKKRKRKRGLLCCPLKTQLNM